MGILKNSMARPRSDRIEAMCDGNGETNEWVFELFPNLKEFLTQLKGEHGMTVVLVGQNVEFARRASHRFVLLDRGIVAARGSVSELSDDLVHRNAAV